MKAIPWAITLMVFAAPALTQAQNRDRNTLVLNDRQRVVDDGYWIYNNLAKGR